MEGWWRFLLEYGGGFSGGDRERQGGGEREDLWMRWRQREGGRAAGCGACGGWKRVGKGREGMEGG